VVGAAPFAVTIFVSVRGESAARLNAASGVRRAPVGLLSLLAALTHPFQRSLASARKAKGFQRFIEHETFVRKRSLEAQPFVTCALNGSRKLPELLKAHFVGRDCLRSGPGHRPRRQEINLTDLRAANHLIGISKIVELIEQFT
jgi:hypothetical protein